MTDIMAKYELWCTRATEDKDITDELNSVKGQDAEIRDRFYRELAFGTGGLRGVIGAGSNRMNIYTVRKATQGLADYLNGRYDNATVAVSFDSRIKSDLFAREAACVMAANGITVHLFPQLEPTPVLSYATRYYSCQAGIMVTASHNPAKYNGYKVYGSDGCQVTDTDAGDILGYINKVDLFEDVKTMAYDEAVASGKINLIPDSVLDSYTEKVLEQQVNPGIIAESGLRLVYTPLNGTGNLPVREMLRRVGIQDLTIVKEQELPDGNFPTAPFPNPEIRQAFECALATAKALPQPADLLLATDPDADRVGIAVWDGSDYTLMSGNEVGCLLLDYVASCRKANGTLPENPVVIKTIVTTNMAKSIAQKYDCELRDLLTGFKYIGEQIGMLEKDGEEHRYVIGFEESYGYLAGGYVRDKDAVVASMLIVEMASYYRKKGLSLLERMEQLYQEHGFYRNALVNVAFEGEQGMHDMQKLMAGLRQCPPKTIAGIPVVAVADYGERVATDLLTGEKTPLTLPKSDVLAYTLEGGAGFIVRPSGTEPKVKAYITAIGETPAAAAELEQKLCDEAEKILTV